MTYSKELLKQINQAASNSESKLRIINQRIDTIPAQVFTILSLEELEISYCQLKEIPPEIKSLENLKTLILSDNDLSQIPDELFDLKNLEILSLSGNKLRSLSAKITNLHDLKILRISGNKFTTFPHAILQLLQLKELHISGNELATIPDELLELNELELLELSFNKLQSLPSGINRLEKLASLDIGGNLITTVPNELFLLKNLRELSISKSDIEILPEDISLLYKLEFLNLRQNHLAELPVKFSSLSQLQTVDLRSNEFSTVPSSLCTLSNLKKLDMGGNKITSIPEQISNLRNLKILSLSENRIENIPQNIKHLSQLQQLGLRKNNIKALPQGVKLLNNLNFLDLRDNPIEIPIEIKEKTNAPKEIFSVYFSEKKKGILETKILIVGQGNVGKTSIINRIIWDYFDPNENKTEGISITRWQVDDYHKIGNVATNIALNIWDFGGQEIMHATHQFFLTKRSLYLLVLDSRLTQEENRVEYWLKIIQSFGGESPVIIVGNKSDQHPLDIDRTGLVKKYPNIVGIIETSASKGEGIEALRVTLTDQVNSLQHVRDQLPETWFRVKAQLEKLGREHNFITHDRYVDLCAENEIVDSNHQQTLLGFLHDLGIIIHFQDEPSLSALGILNPQWVTNGVYKILNAYTLFQNKGVLERFMLNEILNLSEYPDSKRLFIVDMMRKFELCYDLEPDKTFLVPDLLPKDEPFIGEWDGTLAFQYHYNVLPSNIITRFIVRMNTHIHKTVWRSGVVLKRGDNTALVKADTEDRIIYIRVNGTDNTRRDFLSMIRGEFEAIHKTIIKIEATEKVPHPDYPGLILDYAELLQFERDGVTEFPRSVDGKTIKVNVRRLLNGVAPEADRLRGGNVTNNQIGNDFTGNLAVGEENAAQSTSAVAAQAMLQPEPVKLVEPAVDKQSLSAKILTATFVIFPRLIGRFVLDLFGRDKAVDSSAILLGYVLIVLSVLMLWGIIDATSLGDWFAGWWRFFFPVK